jgi:hypothetical protein
MESLLIVRFEFVDVRVHDGLDRDIEAAVVRECRKATEARSVRRQDLVFFDCNKSDQSVTFQTCSQKIDCISMPWNLSVDHRD